MTKQDRWNKLQSRYRTLQSEIDNLETPLVLKYGADNWRTWATRTELRPIESRRRNQNLFGGKIMEFLDANSDRQWHSGVPYWWIMTELTYEDAVRPANEPLSVVPPVPFGGTLHQVRRFAGHA